jgi:hypothetical protein
MKAVTSLMMAGLLASFSTKANQDIVSQDELVEALQASDIGIIDVAIEDPKASESLPKGFDHHIVLTLEEVAPKGGQFFICQQKAACQALAVYFEALAFLAGPHRFSSPSGHVFAQLNSEVSEETAEDIRAVIEVY